MKWLKRGCWLVAWSIWLWLGIGLYRELPKELGPVVRTLPFQAGERPLGFLPDGKSVATLLLSGMNAPATIFVYDLDTGSRRRTIPGPTTAKLLVHNVNISRHDGRYVGDVKRCGVILSKERPATVTRGPAKGLHLLDLAEGTWREITKEDVNFAVLHDSRPWVLFKERMPDRIPYRRIAVVDYKTGDRLFEQDPIKSDGLVGNPFFIPGSNRLVLPMKRTDAFLDFRSPGRFEVWTVGLFPTMQMVNSVMINPNEQYAPSASGLIGITSGMMKDRSIVDVVDVSTGLMKASFPPMAERSNDPRRSGFGMAYISPNGRTVMTGLPGESTLWDVETKKRLWTSKPKALVEVYAGENLVIERESWSKTLESWVGKKPWLSEFNTVVWRDFETGRMQFRTRQKSHRSPDWTSLDGSLSIGPDGTINRMPYRVHWPFLAFCQLILASPLLLLWAILQRRKRRRACLGIAESMPST